ncbi:unnamed protein product [Angiostrongylus costaricensis]|uniref:Methyltransf_21 domain-containing protein n=1 Tax=Angiostrongylus costaricensis TaxID=334426 RepID=A0A0R3PWD0_ANGCS|nr:unnamed protein product [Angiostrongylus costaricensis]
MKLVFDGEHQNFYPFPPEKQPVEVQINSSIADATRAYTLQVSQPSVVVSVGIGADVQVEEKLKELLPEGSEFFGADPVRVPNEALYSKVGTFFPYAISVHSGFHPSQIRLDDGLYRSTVVENVDMLTFLVEIVQREFVDHMIMDNEGPEYDIVPMMAVDNLFPDNNIVVCHMNVEPQGRVAAGAPEASLAELPPDFRENHS